MRIYNGILIPLYILMRDVLELACADPSSQLSSTTPSWQLEISHSLSIYITKSVNATNQNIIFSWKAGC